MQLQMRIEAHTGCGSGGFMTTAVALPEPALDLDTPKTEVPGATLWARCSYAELPRRGQIGSVFAPLVAAAVCRAAALKLRRDWVLAGETITSRSVCEGSTTMRSCWRTRFVVPGGPGAAADAVAPGARVGGIFREWAWAA